MSPSRPRRRRRRAIASSNDHAAATARNVALCGPTKPGDQFYHPVFDGQPKGTHWWFDSIEQYVRFVSGNSLGACQSSSRITGRGTDWDFGVGWEGAQKLAREGWPEGAEKIEQLLDRIEGHIRKLLPMQRNVMRPAMVGGRVSVPAYLAGHPKQFLTLKREAATCKTITMVVSSAMSSMISAEANMRRGVAIAAAVRALEQRRIRVELVSLKANEDFENGGRTAFACVVKRAQDKLQSDVVAFALAHSAFPRRFGFACQEASSNATGIPVPSGYGMATNFEIPEAVNIPTKPCLNDEQMEAFALEIIHGILQD